MPSRLHNLQRRGNVYRLRVRVPDALRAIVGKTEVTRSLGTSDYRVACQKVRLARSKLDGEWEELRRRLVPEAPAPLREQDVLHLVAKWLVAADRNSTPSDADSFADEPTYEAALGELANVASWDMIAPAVYQSAKRLLEESNLSVAGNDQLFLQLQNVLHRAMVETERRRINRQFPEARLSLDPMFREAVARKDVKPVAKSLSALIVDFQKDPSRPDPHGKTLLKRQAQWRLLECFFGSQTAITAIGREDVRRFMSFLETFPSNASKHFPNVDPVDVPALARAKKLPVISIDTANDYLRQLGSLTRFAFNEGIIQSDPAAGLLFKPKKSVAAKDKRLPFSTDDLKLIFGAPLYRGCVNDERGYAKPGPNIIRRGRFWVPLISLFTGMRLNEICQLTLDDFAVFDATDVILIRGTDDETKRVKTDAGQRFVPVHPELRAIGLLDHVQRKRKLHCVDAPLFEELSLGSTGYRSDGFSKFFARFLDHVCVSHTKKVFHSFRHTYRDALREADISPERVRALGGWTSGRTEEAYGSGFKPSTLAKEVEKVRYDGLDLCGLHWLPAR